MSKDTKKCPYCGEEISIDAIKCKHCKEWLNLPETSSNENTEKENNYGCLVNFLVTCLVIYIGLVIAGIIYNINEIYCMSGGVTSEQNFNYDKIGTFAIQWRENNTAHGRLTLKDTFADDVNESRSRLLDDYILIRLEYPDGRIVSKDLQPISYDKNYIDFTFNDINREEAMDMCKGDLNVTLKQEYKPSYYYYY